MPAPVSYPPRSDADIAAWAANASTLITATPTAYGLTSGQATTFATAKSDYATKLATAVNPPTRTKATVAAKNTSRAALLVLIRSYTAIVQAFPTILDSQLEDLGMTVRKTTPTPIPAPGTSPILSPVGSSSSDVRIRLSDETTPDSRARPFGVIAAEIWASIGITPPSGPEDTSFRTLVTKNTYGPGTRAALVQFSGADVGKTAYMYARWVNRRGEPGPWSVMAPATIAA